MVSSLTLSKEKTYGAHTCYKYTCYTLLIPPCVPQSQLEKTSPETSSGENKACLVAQEVGFSSGLHLVKIFANKQNTVIILRDRLPNFKYWAEFLYHGSCGCTEICHTLPYEHRVHLDTWVLLQPSFCWHLFMELIFIRQMQTTVSRERILLSDLALSLSSL